MDEHASKPPSPAALTQTGERRFRGNTGVFVFLLIAAFIAVLYTRHNNNPNGFFVGAVLFVLAIGYYMYQTRALTQADLTEKNPYPAIKPRDPNKPPTSEETKKAHNHLRVALAIRDDAFKQQSVDLQLQEFARASQSLARARAADPAVTVMDKTRKGEDITYTQDDLAGELLSLESSVYEAKADISFRNWNNIVGIPSEKYRARTYEQDYQTETRLALAAITKAIAYNPLSVYFARQVVLCRQAGDHKSADAILAYALNRAPDNIDLLKLQGDE